MKRVLIVLLIVIGVAALISVSLVGSGSVGQVKPGWTVTEDCTPVSVGDSSGSVGSLSLDAAATDTSIFAVSNRISLESESGTWQGQVTSAPVTGLNVHLDAAGELAFLNASRTAPPCGNFTEYVGEFGTTGTGNGQMTSVGDVVFDSAGNLFVADRGNFRIQKFVPDGLGGYTYSAQVGSSGSGNGQFGTAPGGLITVGFLAVDSTDRVYATDPGNNRVQRFTNALVYSTQFGTAGAGNGQFNVPLGIAIDASNNVFVADFLNTRIQKFDSSYAYVSKWTTLYASGPYGMDTDSSGNLYVTFNGAAHAVQKYSNTGVAGVALATTGAGPGEFATGGSPYGVSVDSSGYVYVTDLGNNRVQKFDSSLVFVGQFGSYGNAAGQFKDPRGIAVSSTGLIAVADFTNNRVQTFTSPGDNRIALSEVYQRYFDLCDTEGRTFTYTAAVDPLVVYPGWTDKVWNKIKQLGAATHTETYYTGGAIVVGDIGTRTLDIGDRTVPRITPNVQGAARSIELTDNNIEYGDGLTMYTAESVYRVGVGETNTLIVSTDNSPTVVNNPIPVDTTVGAGQYRISDATGAAVTAATWTAAGGRITAVVGAGTGQIEITFTGPTALIAATTAPYYFSSASLPALSITGSGVTTTRELFTMRTGAPEDKITREVASAEYNPFLSGTEQMYDRGMWFAVESMAGVDFTCTIPLDPTKDFGEYQGCIITHDDCKYRVVRATVGALGVDLIAKWHVTVADVDEAWSGLTVAQVDSYWSNFEVGDELIKPLRMGRPLNVYGHSMAMVPGAYITADHEWSTLLASQADMIRTSHALNGARMIEMAAYAIGTGISGGSGDHHYLPGTPGAVVIQCETNDAINGPATTAGRAGFEHALRALLATVTAAQRIESSTATAVGTWSTFANQILSAGSLRFNALATNTLTFSGVSAPGGKVYVLTLATTLVNTSGNLQVAVDGVDQGITYNGTDKMENFTSGIPSAAPAWNASYSPAVITVTVPDTGTHDIRLTHATNNNTVYVDALLIPGATSPTVVVCKDPAVSSLASAPTQAAWNANSPALHTLIDTVTAEFPSAVVVDLNVGWDPATMIASSDASKIHPSDAGMQHIANLLRPYVAAR